MSKQAFFETFGHEATALFSAPGRTELGGNHTDHQHGKVIAGAVNLETLCWVGENGTSIIRLQSEGYPMCEIDLTDLSIREDEKNSTASLIRGIAAKYTEMGAKVSGFDAYCTSTVLPGSGLSSSAAFEVLVGTVINGLFYDGKSNAIEIAQIGQWAENVYFGKPCGLMDQMASSCGNIITIDFADTAKPVVERIDFDFDKAGYALCIIDSGADHADLTDEYAAIPYEMKEVCKFFGKNVLREVDEAEFYERLAEVRAAVADKGGDRAILRAIHIFEENKRVDLEVAALKAGDFESFLKVVKESGRSSYMYLQNVIPAGYKVHQDVAFALAVAEKLLDGRGAVRVHGGGFAGTIQAFVPVDMVDEFKAKIEKVLKKDACHVLKIRSEGGIRVQ